MWCLLSDLYKEYHDQEWELQFMTMPHYSSFTLETFQALSWITILNKRKIFVLLWPIRLQKNSYLQRR
jgi:DNA-3-methyladenine glycosylase I